MAYNSWSWNTIAGGQYSPDNFKCKWVDKIFIQEAESGQISTEPMNTDGYWVFSMEFKCVYPESFIDFLNFYYAHRGGSPFYFRFPFELAGYPEGAEEAEPGGLGPWASEVAIGAGESFTKLVIWEQDDLEFERHPTKENYWQVNGTVILRQI